MTAKKRYSITRPLLSGCYWGGLAGFLLGLFTLYVPDFAVDVVFHFRELLFYLLRGILPPHLVWRWNNPAGIALLFVCMGCIGGVVTGLFVYAAARSKGLRALSSWDISALIAGLAAASFTAVLFVLKFWIHDLQHSIHIMLSFAAAVICGIIVLFAARFVLSAIERWIHRFSSGYRNFIAGIPPVLILLYIIAAVSQRMPVSVYRPEEDLTTTKKRKVVVVGIDGAEWSILNRLAGEGKLPHLQELIEKGSTGYLRSLKPLKSPVIWTTIASGLGSHYHGITDFIARRSGRSAAEPVTSDLIKVNLLWEMASEHNLTSGVVGWHLSWPAQPVRGYQIADFSLYDSLDRKTFPDSLSAMVEKFNEEYEEKRLELLSRFVDMPPEVKWERGELQGLAPRESLYLKVLDKAFHQDFVTLNSLLTMLDRHGQPDLLAFYFIGTDRVQHKLYKYYWEEYRKNLLPHLLFEAPEDTLRLAETIFEYYMFIDEALGRVLDRIDREASDVIVLSDHGFGPILEKVNFDIDELLRQGGFLVMDEETGEIDMERTLAFGTGNFPWDRKKNITIQGGNCEDHDRIARLQQKVADYLRGLKTAEGSAILKKVEILKDPDDDSEKVPDIRVTFSRDIADQHYIIQDEVHHTGEFVNKIGSDSGHHRMSGVIVLSGNSFERGKRLHHASVIDIVPTIACVLGIPISEEIEGTVIQEGFTAEFRRHHSLLVERKSPFRQRKGVSLDQHVTRSVKEQLRLLGYIQ
jgi:predicted AlkP superfamily phosphohydrolase/phosphomutase